MGKVTNIIVCNANARHSGLREIYNIYIQAQVNLHPGARYLLYSADWCLEKRQQLWQVQRLW